MKPWFWLTVAAIGWAMMLGGYASRTRIDPSAPWSSGLIVIGRAGEKQKPKSEDKAAPKTASGPNAKASENPPREAAFRDAIPVRLRLIPTSDVAEFLMIGLGDGAPKKAVGTKAAARIKLIEVPFDKAGLSASWLQSGRLPDTDRDEIVAGARIEPREQLLLGGRKLKVVGVLKPDVALLADSLLIPPSNSADKLFSDELPSVFDARLVPMQANRLRDEKTRLELEKAFPTEKYAAFTPPDRLEPRAYYLYTAGFALLLLGGSGALIGFYRWLAERPIMSGKPAIKFLAAPILEMRQRPRLLWAVHLIYFGLVIAASVLVYEQPGAQAVFLGKIQEAISAKSGPLAAAGKAYLSGNIARAAAVTFVINFFLGSIAFITIPSVILFGAGLVFSWLRALLWGLFLAPTLVVLAYTMLPHSGTMLLEGEGYILAAFFGALIPIHTVSSRLGGNPLSRWGRVLLLNLTANFWIALVLAIAAIYEATEVILLNQ